MRLSGEKEIEVVRLLNEGDPQDRKHCIRLIETFDWNDHLCIIYECLSINLRETLSKFGKDKGISLDAICSYGR